MKRWMCALCACALLFAVCAVAEADYAAAYTEVLEQLYYNHTFPNGDEMWLYEPKDVELNRFAIYDVDGDGRRELLVEWNMSDNATNRLMIYDYDSETDSVREELYASVYSVFYDNGIIEMLYSHNHSNSLDFWPYSLFRYDPQLDTYEYVGDAEAWDLEYMEEMECAEDFPADKDTNGNGIVYYISDNPGWENAHWADDEEYEAWRISAAGAGRVQRDVFVDLTLENIHASWIMNP